ncbi:hypothetical protein EDB83DRAFT_2425864 [Lactarius deliciosus]|nr:hypothetical protein EDB83DRAFT_2425864 [Lactarius deliciosus]
MGTREAMKAKPRETDAIASERGCIWTFVADKRWENQLKNAFDHCTHIHLSALLGNRPRIKTVADCVSYQFFHSFSPPSPSSSFSTLSSAMINLAGATRASPEPLQKPLASANVGVRSARGPAAFCASTQKATQTQTIPTTGADVPRGGSSAPNSAGRSRPGRRANTSKEAESAWFDKTTGKRHSEPGAAARSNDDDLHHRMARLHLIATTATGERIHAPSTASGNSTDAPRTRKLLLIGARPREEDPGTEKPQQSSHLQGPENGEKGADARKAAWEVLKRRVLDAEEHGGSPPFDIGRGGWAEEVMRVNAREESVKSTKKRRRDAGCWIRENGALLKVHCHSVPSRAPLH